MAEQDPNNTRLQSDLAATLNRVGGVLETQGKLTEAQAAFEEALAISRRMAEQDPNNADWKSALAGGAGLETGTQLVLQPIMPLDLPVKVRSWELTVYPRSHIRR